MILLDTSALIRLVIVEHPDHAAVETWYSRRVGKTDFLAATHALAESFKVMSGKPFNLPHDDCRRVLRGLRTNLSMVSLTEPDYFAAIEATMRAGMSGGAIYDALHVAAATKKGARVATCDLRSFPKLLPPSRLMNPLDTA